jgi:hypothetical protein
LLLIPFSLYANESKNEEWDGTYNICGKLEDEKCLDFIKEALSGKKAKEVRADFFVPESPAFSVLGVTPDATIKPETTRDLAFSLLNGVDPSGNLQTGLAIDTSPYLLSGVDLPEYINDPFKRLLARSQVSVATTKGSDDNDKSVRASIGLRMTFFDFGDPRLDAKLYEYAYNFREKLKKEREKAHKQLADELASANDETAIKEIEKKLKELTQKINNKEIKEEWTSILQEKEKGRWNSSSGTFGIAPLFISDEGAFNDLESNGYTVYATLSYGFETLGEKSWLKKNVHLLLHTRFTADEKESSEDENDEARELDIALLGAQIRFQGPKIWSIEKGGDLAFSLEADYIQKDFEDGGDEDSTRYTGTVELKPFKNSGTTLKISVGGESGGEEDESFVISSINWAFD